ncbi:MAG: glycoside hydrolase family 15 [Pseudonocardiales bacterium]|nr:MAG: glycoside hydrolase family 15 [Pseudonocardiales bacterium]
MSDVALDQHALLSDCGAAALVTSAGSVDWLCLPRFDSAPVMARLLDNEAGHFLIAPAGGGAASSRRYLPFGLVLETTWETPEGALVLIEAMALGRHERGHELGRTSPGVLLRLARCVRGAVSVRVEYAPRPEFGLVHPRLSAAPNAVVAHGGATVVVLSTQLELDFHEATASTVVMLTEGQALAFALEQASAWAPRPAPWSARKIHRGLDATETSWRSWSQLHQRYEGPHKALVHHSGVVLQGLTCARTGAMVAAPTTSLPEGVGSGRTWDYRFTWVRDASMTLQGLWISACPDEAGRFFSFLATAASTQLVRGLDLQIMFGIGGERDLSERELGHLSGWRDSGPVRAGNGAWRQRQLDVYGALLDAAYTLREQLGELDEATRGFLVAAVDAATSRWRQDDQGIWEIRGPARPYLHSKLMCWVAVDRGLAMSQALRPGQDKAATWSAVRDKLRDAILAQGWSDRAGAFTQAFGSDELDASTLLLAITGFLPPDDARLLATIDAVERDLVDERGLLYRYRGDDGLDEPEGTFLLCTFWLAHALAVTGQIARARVVLGRAADCATSLGLFSEQIDTDTGELLGNFPQAFSHLGLVTAAHALALAEEAEAHRRS